MLDAPLPFALEEASPTVRLRVVRDLWGAIPPEPLIRDVVGQPEVERLVGSLRRDGTWQSWLHRAGVYGWKVSLLQQSLKELDFRNYAAVLVTSDAVIAEGRCPGLAAEMFRAMCFITADERRNLTWRPVSSGKYARTPSGGKREKQDLLIVYVDGQPDLKTDLAAIIGRDPQELRETSFEADASAVCDALDGIYSYVQYSFSKQSFSVFNDFFH